MEFTLRVTSNWEENDGTMTVITPRPAVVAGRRLFWEQEPSPATFPDAIIYHLLLLTIEQKHDEQQFFCTKTILLGITTQYFFTRNISDRLQTLQGKSCTGFPDKACG